MSQFPPPPAGQAEQQGLKPHRGAAVLVLGILALTICFICGIVAWVMGNNDLRAIDAGHMDPSGRDLTLAGKICGMVSVILLIVGAGLYLIFFLGMAVIGASSASGG